MTWPLDARLLAWIALAIALVGGGAGIWLALRVRSLSRRLRDNSRRVGDLRNQLLLLEKRLPADVLEAPIVPRRRVRSRSASATSATASAERDVAD